MKIIFTGFGLNLIIFTAIQPSYRVLADETNLINVSQVMHQEMEVYHPIEGKIYHNTLYFTDKKIPHRPVLFPFLISLVHAVSGYRAENAFVINFLVGLGIFIGMGFFVYNLFGLSFSILIQLALFSQPLLILNLTSAGFDAINLLFFLFVIMAVYHFLKNPHIGLNVELLILLFILGAQCRYETAILAIPIGMLLLWKYRPQKIKAHSSWMLSLPILAMPILWQRSLSHILTNAGDADKAAFQAKLFIPHIVDSFKFFFNYHTIEMPTNAIFSFLAIIGFGLFVKNYFKGKMDNKKLFPTIIFMVFSMLLIAIVHFSYYLGNYTLAFISRYAMIHLIGLCFFATYVLNRLFDKHSLRIAISILCIFFGIRSLIVANNDVLGKTNTLYNEYKKNLVFFRNQKKNQILILSDRPSIYLAQGYSSASIPKPKQLPIYQLELSNGIYEKIYLVDHSKNNKYLADKKWFKLSYKYLNNAGDMIKIYKLHKPKLIDEAYLEKRFKKKK